MPNAPVLNTLVFTYSVVVALQLRAAKYGKLIPFPPFPLYFIFLCFVLMCALKPNLDLATKSQ
jgi:hypothetical protein